MADFYWVQVNDYMEPAKVKLTDEQVQGVIATLKAITESDPSALCGITDNDGEEYYSNWSEWVKFKANELKEGE